ncbi:MAG: hypothetical protein K5864_04525 [Bacteroidales bacterium]|nr:hypothetical protein [Bacteroidales bacterium]
MKKIATIIVAVLLVTVAMAQEYGRVAINVVVPQLPNVPEEAHAALETKMQQVATQYGLASNGLTDRFVMTAKVNVTSKDIAPTTPVKISQKMEVTLFIGDVLDNKVYESVVLSVAGIGQSETQSMINAFNQIKPMDPRLKAFVENAERKIAEYYTNNCSYILTEANALAQQRKYDAAIAKLMAVPEVCKECYEQCMARTVEVYQTKLNNDGDILVKKARSQWIAKRDYASASEALRTLSNVDPQSSAQGKAQVLVDEINKHLRNMEAAAEAQRREEWEFAKKQYEDNLAMARQRQADATTIRREQIAAAKEVGIAYGKNQPKTITYNNFRTW